MMSARAYGARAYVVAAAVIASTLLVVATVLFFRPPPSTAAMSAGATTITLDSAAVAPSGTRVRVVVWNGAGVSGLARRGMQTLRDYGYDVVDYTNARATVDSTRIEVRAQHEQWALRVQRALGVGEVRVVDSLSGYTDIRVTLGVDWKPPAHTFRP